MAVVLESNGRAEPSLRFGRRKADPSRHVDETLSPICSLAQPGSRFGSVDQRDQRSKLKRFLNEKGLDSSGYHRGMASRWAKWKEVTETGLRQVQGALGESDLKPESRRSGVSFALPERRGAIQ